MKKLIASLALVLVCLPVIAAKGEATPQGYLRVTIPQWDLANEFTLTSLSGQKKVFAWNLKDRAGQSSHGGWIDAGEYQILDLLGADGKPYAPIVVRAGQLTDLGTLLRVPLGGYEYVVLASTNAQSDADSDSVRAQLASKLMSPDVIRWQPGEPPQARRKAQPASGIGLVGDLLMAYERKVNKPPLAKALKETRDPVAFMTLAKSTMAPRTEQAAADRHGNLYYGAELGQIRVRDAAGNWSSRDTGTFLEVTAVGSSGESLVAGNLHGQIYSSQDSGLNWRLAHALNSNEVVLDIDRAGDRWLVLAAPCDGIASIMVPTGAPPRWAVKPTLRIYSGTRDDLSDLALLKEVPTPKATTVHGRGQIDVMSGQVVGSTYVVNALAAIHRLDLRTMDWSVAASGPGQPVYSVRFSADGKVMTVGNRKLMTSTDFGNTWTPYQRPASVFFYDVAFDTAGYAEGSRWRGNAFSVTVEFYRYDAATKGWRKTSEAPPGCVALLRDGGFNQRYCLTSGGSILSQRDGVWTAEFALE